MSRSTMPTRLSPSDHLSSNPVCPHPSFSTGIRLTDILRLVTSANVPSPTPSISLSDAITKAETLLNGKFNEWPATLEFVAKQDGSLALTHVIQIQNDETGLWVEAFIDAQTAELVHVTDFVTKATVSLSTGSASNISLHQRTADIYFSTAYYQLQKRSLPKASRSWLTHRTPLPRQMDGIATEQLRPPLLRTSMLSPIFIYARLLNLAPEVTTLSPSKAPRQRPLPSQAPILTLSSYRIRRSSRRRRSMSMPPA